ncbi:unnamed protein product [Phaedon cochleariae]|uniref:Coatomer subunit zeta n=1 Tax=Phaedon cochleariae TaxID=80249 RepID=A0A9P0DTY9_PHACE|nr:unnamed protein product [Phaedon cochleariae]
MEGSLLEPTLYTIKGIAVLDNDGNRILTKYYDKNIFPSSKEQRAFEQNLFNKTHRANAEIIMLDGLTCVYRSNVDLFFYIMGSSQENELILMNILNCLYDSVSQILRKNVEKRAVLESLDIVMLAMDEICDGGFSDSEYLKTVTIWLTHMIWERICISTQTWKTLFFANYLQFSQKLRS